MSTNSATGFEWSVKLIGTWHFAVGIATMLQRDTTIYTYDQEAILFNANNQRAGGHYSPDIRRGTTTIHSHLRKPRNGDVIRFKFQPDAKRLIIYWVRKKDSSSNNL